MLVADAVEDVATEDRLDLGVAAAVLGQVGKGHAVVGQHGMDPIREDLDDLAQEGGTVQLGIASKKATWTTFETRSMARNMKSLPWASRSSQMSMWT